MSNGAFFEIGLEKNAAPVYPVELHESLSSQNINQMSLQKKLEFDNFSEWTAD